MSLRILFWRNLYRVINPLRRLYWRIVKPKTRGVKCVVRNGNKFLLVRLAYAHKQWTFPGGGVGKRESFKDAAFRELREETGIHLTHLDFFGEYQFQIEHKRDTVECFYAEVDSMDITIDPLEISEAGWFDLEHLPGARRGTVDTILEMYHKSIRT